MTKKWKRIAALSSAVVMATATLLYFPSDTLQNISWKITASAESVGAVTWTKTESDGLTWTLYEDGTLTISGTGAMKDYDYSANQSPVYNNLKVKKVVIEDGVTSIGNWAFESCNNLISITIPDGVTSIGAYAFSNCWYLTNITIPNSVTSIENYAFRNCSSLTSITIPNSVTSIGSYAFSDCRSLTSITIPDSVTSIEDGTFSYCRSLTSITIPDSVTSIGKYAFYDCSNLTSITIPDSVTSIGYYAFRYCSSLTSITIPDSVTSIGDGAFKNCSSLKAISLSCKSSLKKSDFGDQADLVSASHTLKKTEVKAATCTENGNKEYWTCEHCKKYFLSNDTNPETAKAVEQAETVIPASHKLTKVEAKDATCAENGNKAYWTCEHCGKYFLSDDTNPETAKAVELSEFIISASHKLTKVEAKAATCTEDGNKEYWTCEHCGKYFLSDDTNPETAKAVELSEFIISASHKLTKVEAKAATCTEDGNKEYWTCEHCGKYFLSDDTDPATAKAVELSEFIISASHKLTKVEAKAATCTEDGNKEYWTCEHCGKYFLSDDTDPATAKAVELSETILPAIQHKNATIRGAVEPTETAPGYSGDRYCPDCDTVLEKGYTYWIEDNLTWKLYEDGTLNISGTGAMKNYTDYSSNQSPVFDNDTIKSVVIEDGVTSIGNSAFEGCGGLISITIPDSVTSIGNFAFSGCVSLTNITIPNSVTCIGMKGFGGCSGLTSITIPNSITSIDEGAFEFCSSLTSILLPDGITSIGVGAFGNCESLTDITIPDGVISIGDWAFEDCSNLTSITIPSSVTNIGIRAFDGCSNLTSITIPDGVTSIGDWAFYHCNSLTNITIPGSVTNIGHSTFFGCKNLTSITILDGVTSIGMSVFSSCESLTDIIIPNSVTSIEEDAFSNCKSLTSITIPNSVTSIENFVFLGCSSLTDVTIPDSVTSIGTWAFKDCSSLTSITIPNSVTSIGEAVFDNCNDLTDIYYLDTKMKWKKISISEDAISPDVTIHFVEPATTVYGDVNLDGKVDILDAVFLNKYLATMVQFSDVQAANADCCQDDVLNEKDASALLQFVILLIDDLPVSPVQE